MDRVLEAAIAETAAKLDADAAIINKNTCVGRVGISSMLDRPFRYILFGWNVRHICEYGNAELIERSKTGFNSAVCV